MYRTTVTDAGTNLIAKLFKGGTLTITKVMVGSGKAAVGMDIAALKNLVQPIAEASSTIPLVIENEISFIIEYRNDMNGGLESGFWLSELGLFAKDPDDGEILLFYATLDNYPQFVAPYDSKTLDTKRFPVAIAVSQEIAVELNYPAKAWVSSDDVDVVYRELDRKIKDISADVTGNYVPKTRKVNNKELSSDISLTPEDIGAVPSERNVNNKELSSDITLDASDVGAVPATRKVNDKELSSDVTLGGDDIKTTLTDAAGSANLPPPTAAQTLTQLIQTLRNGLKYLITGLGTAATKNTGTSAGNVPLLDTGGKLDTNVMPSLALTETYVVSTQASMLALAAQPGDVAIRTDLSKTFILAATPPATLSNWKEFLTPASPVQSVAGKTGAVSLVKSDVGLGSVDDTADADKSVKYAASAGSATPTAHNHDASSITSGVFPTSRGGLGLEETANHVRDMIHTAREGYLQALGGHNGSNWGYYPLDRITCFVQYLGLQSAAFLNNANYQTAYEAVTSDGTGIGLAAGWWHLRYFAHVNRDGHGAQLAIGLSVGNQMLFRTSSGVAWNAWAKVLTSESAGQVKADQGGSGGYTFNGEISNDTGMFSDADGDIYFKQNGGVKRPYWNTDKVANASKADSATSAISATSAGSPTLYTSRTLKNIVISTSTSASTSSGDVLHVYL